MIKIIEKSEIADYIGYEAEPTEWFEIDQSRVNQFADVTLDHQFIHVDEAQAKDTPFGGTIAHGFLTLSMIAHFSAQFSILIEGATMGLNYGFDKVRFLAPVKTGGRIRCRATVADIHEKDPGQFLIRYRLNIEIENEETPALVADWLGLVVTA